MCKLCEEWGNGDKWYLNPEIYKYKAGDDVGSEAAFMGWLGEWVRLQDTKEGVMGASKVKKHQIVPIEDALKIADMNEEHATEVVFDMFPCLCAMVHTGESLQHCMDFGFTALATERWVTMAGQPFPPPGEHHARVSKEEWKERLIQADKDGYVHNVMLFGVAEGSGYIGHICNCKLPYCSPLRGRDSFGQDETYMKAHYVADVNALQCVGCGKCASYCQFGAIRCDHKMKSSYIDPRLCAGCGVCRNRCDNDAITLVDRERVPVAKNTW